MVSTFLWHDYETNGVDPTRDRANQFAAIRTNMDLEEIEDPIEIFALPHKDTLPQPIACLITGITPNKIFKMSRDPIEGHKVLNEYDFFKKINEHFSVPYTCGVGYNNISYDDEVSRNGFYRNLIDPYAREYQNNCSRWDIMNVIRLFAVLYPNDIIVPVVDGKPSFRLELLTHENGIVHEKAHDAVSDVRATIAMAKFMKDKKPEFWDYCFAQRNKKQVLSVLENNNDFKRLEPVLYVSPFFGGERMYSEIVLSLGKNSKNPNEFFLVKLTKPLEELKKLLESDATTLKELLYSKTEDLEGKERPPVNRVQINKCPVMISTTKIRELLVETGENSQDFYSRMGFDMNVLKENLRWVRENYIEIKKNVLEVFKQEPFRTIIDPDLAIYSDFIKDEDKPAMYAFHKDLADGKIDKYFERTNQFLDARFNILARRVVLRNFPNLVENEKIKEGWEKHCFNRLTQGYSLQNAFTPEFTEKSVSITLPDFMLELKNSVNHPKYDKTIIDELTKYGERMGTALKIDISSIEVKGESSDIVDAKKNKKNKMAP